jgi:hypothetical protein
MEPESRTRRVIAIKRLRLRGVCSKTSEKKASGTFPEAFRIVYKFEFFLSLLCKGFKFFFKDLEV